MAQNHIHYDLAATERMAVRDTLRQLDAVSPDLAQARLMLESYANGEWVDKEALVRLCSTLAMTLNVVVQQMGLVSILIDIERPTPQEG